MTIATVYFKCNAACSRKLEFFVEPAGDDLAVYFGPTLGPREWLRNFCCWTKTWYGRRVHAGYLAEWLRCQSEVESSILTELTRRVYRSVTFYGYSQGGAIALLAYERLRRTFLPTLLVRAVLVGSPRPFLRQPPMDPRETTHHHVIEVIYGHDLVPGLPWWFDPNPADDYMLHPAAPGRRTPFKDHIGYATWNDELDWSRLE